MSLLHNLPLTEKEIKNKKKKYIHDQIYKRFKGYNIDNIEILKYINNNEYINENENNNIINEIIEDEEEEEENDEEEI